MADTLQGLQKINIIPNKNYKKSGTKSYVHLLSKWGFEPTMPGPYGQMVKALEEGEKRATFHHHTTKPSTRHVLIKKIDEDPASRDFQTTKIGEVPAEDIQNDSLYLCPVQIGSPAQTLYLDFYTGSSDLWVWSTLLDSSARSQPGHTTYDPSNSSTFKSMNGASWEIRYGDNSHASGAVGTDTITLGGLAVESQAIELAKDLSDQFLQSPGDGLLGLAFGSINTVQPNRVHTPVENLILQGSIPTSSQVFAAKLGSWRDANEDDQGQGFYTFGYIDQDTITASGQSLAWTPISSSSGFWQFTSAQSTVNGTTVSQSSRNTAIADTGTTLALVSDAVCEAVYSAIPNAYYDYNSQGWVYPENTPLSDLPVVTIAVGQHQVIIQKEDLGFASVGDGNVYGGIQSRGNLPFDILGDTFLKGIYAVFDQGNKRFGFVQRAEKYQNISPPR
ncbi:Acid protease [Glarea lozoyensis ATCC 20868]|uniref:Acid protease n=1 Tax=Glarea lozoyensis (strain ATCC 20868 / MF5171) TaxID=1116229 RepID=S3CSK7_GLAL2|nr:Acid protease [Glarea lozoyensis ATCC 20868]EPE28650.1 Acid protease [Glarea lozoyensis ATCC 20868]